MATTSTKYAHTHRRMLDGTIDWDTDTIKAALVTSSYTFSASHTVWADASTYEIASGNGYTTGGVTLTNSADNTKLDSTDITWTGLTATFRGIVLYKLGTANSLVNPLIAFIDFGEDVVLTSSSPLFIWSASGVFSIG